MIYRRTQTAALLAAAALAGCSDSPTSSASAEAARRPSGYYACLEPARQDAYATYGQQPQIIMREECWYPPVEPDPVPAPDRTVFYDGSAVEATVDARNNADIETLVAYEQQQGYTSLRAYLDAGEWSPTAEEHTGEDATGSEGIALANDGVTRGDFELGDGILSLLNTRGEMQVGDTVYKLTRDNAYAVHVRDLELLRQQVPTLSSPAPAYDARIVSQAVETTATLDDPGETLSLRAGGAVETSSIGSITNHCTWQVGDRRMKGKSYITNALFYSEAGVKTDWERRKWFGWSNTWQAGTLEYAYSTTSLRLGQNYVFPTSGSGFRTGTSSISKVITSGWFKQIRGTINGTHTSPVGQCYTRVSR